MRFLLSLFLAIFLKFSFGQSINSQYLKIYFPFTGNSQDQSGNGNHGVVFGAQLTTDRFGNSNSAYEFDGVDDFIEINTISNLSAVGDFTLSLWFYQYQWELQSGVSATNLDRQYIFDAHSYSSSTTNNLYTDGPLINTHYTTSSNTFIRHNTFISANEHYPFDLLLNDPSILNSWQHTVLVRKGDKTFHYLNGVLIGSRQSTIAPLDIAHNMFIGTFSGNNPNAGPTNYNFHGKIDDIMFYSEALEGNEVGELFNSSYTFSNCVKVSNVKGHNPSQSEINKTPSYFCRDLIIPGDLNGDGNSDIIIGSPKHLDAGAAIICFLNNQGLVDSTRVLSSGKNGVPSLTFDARFGTSLDTIKDLDGDNIPELIVGAPRYEENGGNQGAIFLLYLNKNGKVKSFKKFGANNPALTNEVLPNNQFGISVRNIGDLDGDGIPEVAVGSLLKDDVIPLSGAAYILKLSSNQNLSAFFRISNSTPNFSPQIETESYFGYDIARINDFDNNGVRDLIITAVWDNDQGIKSGAAYVVLLNSFSSIKTAKKLGGNTAGLPFSINEGDFFGDGINFDDETKRVYISAPFNDRFGNNAGVIHTFNLNQNLIPENYLSISNKFESLKPYTKSRDRLGHAIEISSNFLTSQKKKLVLSVLESDSLGSNKGFVISMDISDSCESCITSINSSSIKICSGDSVITPKGFFAKTAGVYNDTILASMGCDSIVSLEVRLNEDLQFCDSVLGNRGVFGPQLNLYPNPTSDFFTVEVLGLTNYNLNVFDNRGRLVFWKENIQKSKNKFFLGRLAAGVYTVSIINNQFVISEKLVVY